MTGINVDPKLNQNLWFLVITFAALGFAESQGLCFLKWIALISAIAAATSALFTFTYYTRRYCENRKSTASKSENAIMKNKTNILITVLGAVCVGLFLISMLQRSVTNRQQVEISSITRKIQALSKVLNETNNEFHTYKNDILQRIGDLTKTTDEFNKTVLKCNTAINNINSLQNRFNKLSSDVALIDSTLVYHNMKSKSE